MGVGEAGAAEVGHRVRLAPHDVVQDPEAGVLEQRADAEDVVVAADHPDRAVVLEDSPRLAEPGAAELVVGGEAVELVPVVVDRIDPAALGPEQVAAELEIVRRVGEDHVDATCRGGCAISAMQSPSRMTLNGRILARGIAFGRNAALPFRNAGDEIHGLLPPKLSGEG